MRRRRILRLAVAAAVLAIAAPGAQAAEVPTLSEAPSSKFPTRSWLLTLPEKRVLTAADVHITENGSPVRDLRISTTAVGGSAVVLAVDASTSMRGKPIQDAMAAARAFAARRRPDQKLGVVFFSREPHVALEPTTDPAKIDAVLAERPPLSRGTRLFDAADAARQLLADTGAAVSAIVLLSDGADANSAADPGAVVSAARKGGVRVYAVGLRSHSFDSSSLQSLGEAGSYTEASSSRELNGIFASLGERLSNQYLVTYRSTSPLDSRVAVTAAIDGLDFSAVKAYETPRLNIRLFDPARASKESWADPRASRIVVAGIAALVALALFLLVRPLRRSLGERVAGFVGTTGAADGAEISAPPPTPLLQKADERLDRYGAWRNFVLDLELAKVSMPAIRVALIAVALTAVLATVLVLLELAVWAIFMLLIPVAVRAYPAIRAARVRREFDEQLPDNLQVLASALRAGHSFTGALSVMAADAAEPSRSEYRRVVGDDQLGVAIEDSMAVVADRMRNSDVGYIGLVATIQRETGGNTAEVLDRVTVTVRERGQLRRLVRTLTAQGRLGGWVVTCLPIALVGFLTLVRPTYLEPLLDDPVGRLALAFGVLMLGLGAFAINRIVDIKV
jgi:tight adherence protein B